MFSCSRHCFYFIQREGLLAISQPTIGELYRETTTAFLFIILIILRKSYCSTVHFRRITSIYQPTNAHIISHKTLLKHMKTLHVSILSDHQGALFLARIILQYSRFNSYLQTRCCGSISCCVVEQWLGVRRMLSNIASLITQHMTSHITKRQVT